MLYNCKQEQQIRSVEYPCLIALHPKQPTLLVDRSTHLQVETICDQGKLVNPLQNDQSQYTNFKIFRFNYSPCGRYVTIFSLNEQDQIVRMTLKQVNDEFKVIAQVDMTVDDPLKLRPTTDCMVQFEYYGGVQMTQNHLKFIWVCLNQQLKNSVKPTGGYSLNCFQLVDKEQEEGKSEAQTQELQQIINVYVGDTMDHCISFNMLAPQPDHVQDSLYNKATLNFVAIEKNGVRQFKYHMMDQTLDLTKILFTKMETQSAILATNNQQMSSEQLLAICCSASKIKAIDIVSEDEVYSRSADLKYFQPFTVICKNRVDHNLFYAGACDGTIYVFEILTGAFVKAIPFQKPLFEDLRFDQEQVKSAVIGLDQNHANQLLVCYQDGSYLLLDQDKKELLACEYGIGQYKIKQLKWLPLANAQCFFTLSDSILIAWKRPLDQYNNQLGPWQYKLLELNFEKPAQSFDFDKTCSYVSVAFEDGTILSYDLNNMELIEDCYQKMLVQDTQLVKHFSIFSHDCYVITLQNYGTLLLRKSQDGTSKTFVITKFIQDQQVAKQINSHQKVLQFKPNDLTEEVDQKQVQILVQSHPEQIDLIVIKINQDTVQRQVTQIYRCAGQITSFCLHPSNLYLLAICQSGFLYIFGLQEAEVRAKYPIERHCTQIKVDPSGLYMTFVTHGQTIQMLECGTGRKIYEFAPMFEAIGCYAFQNNTRQLIVTDATRNNVTFYEIDPKLADKCQSVLFLMESQPNFWSLYPIIAENDHHLSIKEKEVLRRATQKENLHRSHWNN